MSTTGVAEVSGLSVVAVLVPIPVLAAVTALVGSEMVTPYASLSCRPFL